MYPSSYIVCAISCRKDINHIWHFGFCNTNYISRHLLILRWFSTTCYKWLHEVSLCVCFSTTRNKLFRVNLLWILQARLEWNALCVVYAWFINICLIIFCILHIGELYSILLHHGMHSVEQLIKIHSCIYGYISRRFCEMRVVLNGML